MGKWHRRRRAFYVSICFRARREDAADPEAVNVALKANLRVRIAEAHQHAAVSRFAADLNLSPKQAAALSPAPAGPFFGLTLTIHRDTKVNNQRPRFELGQSKHRSAFSRDEEWNRESTCFSSSHSRHAQLRQVYRHNLPQ